MKNKAIKRRAAMAGASAGLLAGLLMGVAANTGSYMGGSGFWEPMERISAYWLGVKALDGGVLPALVGSISHLCVASAFGAVFGYFTRKIESTSSEVVAGISTGAFIWAFMTYMVLPFFNPVLFDFVEPRTTLWFNCHMLFGLVLGASAPIKRWLANRQRTKFQGSGRHGAFTRA